MVILQILLQAKPESEYHLRAASFLMCIAMLMRSSILRRRRRGTAPGANPHGSPTRTSAHQETTSWTSGSVRVLSRLPTLRRCHNFEQHEDCVCGRICRIFEIDSQRVLPCAGVPLVEPTQEAGMKLEGEEAPYDDIAEQIRAWTASCAAVCCQVASSRRSS